jgi:hypothetical protein
MDAQIRPFVKPPTHPGPSVHLSPVDIEASAQMPPTDEGGIMHRLTTQKLLAIIGFVAVLWAPVATWAADQGPPSTSPLVTPRLVSAIGGGSIEPGAPRRPKPSFSLADATGGGPRFPTRVQTTMSPNIESSGTTTFGWTTLVLATIAFVAGAMSSSIVGRYRGRRPMVPA